MTAQGLVRRLLGELPAPRAPEAGSGPWVVLGVALASLGMMLGEHHELAKGVAPLARGAWRMNAHLLPCLAAVALWELVGRGRSPRLGLAFVALCAAPLGLRFTSAAALLHEPAVGIGAGLSLFVLLAGLLRWRAPDAKDWFLGLGDARFWAPRTAAAAALVVAGAALAVQLSPALARFYPTGKAARQSWAAFGEQHLAILLDFIGWEYLFRGFLLALLMRRGDPVAAILLSTVPFFLLHGGKPPVEFLLSLPGGMLAGWFCLRARTFWPLVLLHLCLIGSVGFFAQLLRLRGG